MKITKHFYEGSLEANYKLFKLEKPDIKIGFTTFRSLKPRHVMKIRLRDRRVCLCKYHTNVMFGVQVFCRIRRFLKGIVLTRKKEGAVEVTDKQPLRDFCPSNIGSASDLWFASKCITSEVHPSMECITGECTDCGLPNMQLEVDDVPGRKPSPPDVVTWSRYEYIDTKNRKGETVKRIHLVVRTDSIKQYLDVFMADWKRYNYHSFEARWQSKCFRDLLDRAESDDKLLVLTADFIMNIGVKPMYEVQSSFFTTSQITLLVFITHHKVSGVISHHFISDDLRHDSAMYASCLEKVLLALGVLNSNASDDKAYWKGKRVVIFTDGAASQFKCANALLSDMYLRRRLGLQRLEHNYFSTSHGKGLHDGEGGSLKYLVNNAMLLKSVGDTLQDAESVYDFSNVNFASTEKSRSAIAKKAADAVVRGRLFYLVKEDDIADYRSRFTTAETIKGTLAQHQFISDEGCPVLDVKYRELTCFCNACWEGKYDECVNTAWVKQPVKHTVVVNNKEDYENFTASDIELGEVVAIRKSEFDCEDSDLRMYRFYLMHVTGTLEKLAQGESDDYQNSFRTGTKVLRGRYYDLDDPDKDDVVFTLSKKKAIVYANSIIARGVKLVRPCGAVPSLTAPVHLRRLRCKNDVLYMLCPGELARIESVF